MNKFATASVPMRTIGPVKIKGPHVNDMVQIPLATYESPLWPSTNRGAKVSRLCGGITAVVLKDQMTRSVVFEAKDAIHAQEIIQSLENRTLEIAHVISETGRFAKFQDWHFQVVGNLVFLRLAIQSADASGHNMVTKAAENVLNWILQTYNHCQYVSISGNYCVDKKVSAVNGILGRGKSVIVEAVISEIICKEVLKTTPQKIVNLHLKKNLIGSIISGGLRTANAHFANMLLAAYLATGQDAANIVEGSQGIVHAEMRGDDLYYSVNLPNLIVGTVGNGKALPFVRENLRLLGCLEENEPGLNAVRLAVIIAASVWCGELSLLAAQTNPGELMRTHLQMERQPDLATT